ncbi:VOC family protein [Arthrobacter pityocampae]|uniref:VOC family protein n=1 Tax=Arthrobacter pityocampae TaxID=547334 RepID=UPI003735EA55
MLRVRPVVSTPDLPGAARFLQALGLTPVQDPPPTGSEAGLDAEDEAVFDAGSGRVALHSCATGSAEDGRVSLAFDVSDVREFARRTAEAGTRSTVEPAEDGHGPTAHVTAPDGLSFPADVGPRETGAPPSPLTVLALWSTPDVVPAVTVLNDIGAKPRTAEAGAPHSFRAKNGGLVAVRAGARPAIGLAFEYDGDVRDLLPGVTGGGFGAVVVDGEHGRSLRIPAPWGAEVRVDERLRDAVCSAAL